MGKKNLAPEDFVRSKPKKNKDDASLPVARIGGKRRDKKDKNVIKKGKKSRAMLPKMPGEHAPVKEKRKEEDVDDIEMHAILSNKFLTRVEIVKPHELCEGCLLLGAIREVLDDELIINLPYGQLATVPKGHAMDYPDFKQRKEPLDKENGPRLQSLYKVGQFVSCVVIKVAEKANSGRKRLEVSLRPSLVNAGIVLRERLWISGSVAKEEEHVVVISFANGLSGNLAKKLLSDVPPRGSIMHVCITRINEKGPAKLKIESDAPLGIDESMDANSVKVGSLVTCRIKKIFGTKTEKAVKHTCADEGLLVSFCGALEGRIHALHCNHTSEGLEEFPAFASQQHVVARVLAVTPDAQIHLTLLPHLVDWRSLSSTLVVPTGEVLEGDVRYVESKTGAWVKSGKHAVYVHISRLADGNVGKAEDVAKIGQILRTRVLGVDYLDGWVLASSSKRIMEEKLLAGASLQPSELVSGTICHVTEKSVYVKLSDFVQGVCNLTDLTDVPLSTIPEHRFKIGKAVKGRVLKIDCDRSKRVRLTLKKSIVRCAGTDEDPLLRRFEDAKRNMVVMGVVTKVSENGMVYVTFFGDAYGVLATKQIPEDTEFKVGQCIRVRITNIDMERKRYRLSLDLTCDATDALADGSIVESAVVERIEDDKVFVTVDDAILVIMKPHLADDMEQATARYQLLQTGSSIGPLVMLARAHVMTKGAERMNLASCKPSLICAAQNGEFVTSLASLEKGTHAIGYIKQVKDFGIFVSLGSFTLAGLALKHCCAQHYVTSTDEFVVGQTVRCMVTDCDATTKRFGIDLRVQTLALGYSTSERNMRREGELLRGYFSIQASMTSARYIPGDIKEGKVTQLKPYGALLQFTGDEETTALALSHQLDSPVAVGDVVQCFILDICPEKRIVDVSLRAHLVEKRMDDCKENECIVQLIKLPYIVGCRHGQVIAFPACENWNSLKTSSVSLQTASFAKKRIVHIASGTLLNRSLATIPPLEKRKHENTKWAEHEKVDPKKLEVGQALKMRVSSMSATDVTLYCPHRCWGHLPLVDVEEEKKQAFSLDSEVTVYVTRIVPEKGKERGKKYHLSVSLEKDAKVLTWGDVDSEASYRGIIVDVKKDRLRVQCGRDIIGCIAPMDACKSLEEFIRLKETFSVGQTLSVRVLRCKVQKRLLDLSILPVGDLPLGEKVLGEIVQMEDIRNNGLCAVVRLPHYQWGYLHCTDVSEDRSEKRPWNKLKLHQIVECYLSKDERYHVSLRQPCNEEIGAQVHGYVINSGPKGVFVAVSRTVTGRIQLRHLSEKKLVKEEVAKRFPVGKLVTAFVLSTSDQGVELSLLEKEVEKQAALNVGDVVSGTVKRIETFGLFIRIQGQNGLCGMAHKSQLADSKSSLTLESFKEGDRIGRAKVLSVENSRISLGLKESYFEKGSESEKEEEDEEEKVVEKREGVIQETKGMESESEDEDAPWAQAAKMKQKRDSFDFGLVEKVDEIGSSDDEPVPKRQKKNDEEDLEQCEQELLDNTEPKSSEEFERLLVHEGDSSVVWIKYMAFHMQLSELEKARQIAERSVKHITYTEEKERFNVWTAFLNLECQFGTPESLRKVFTRACATISDKRMHIQMTHVRERNNQIDEARQAHIHCCEKYPHSKKMWIHYLEFLYRIKEHTVAHEILTKALMALPKRKHVQITTKTATLEYTQGCPERGRTIYEGLVASYPKRLDIWSLYFDVHIKHNKENAEPVRDLFRRAVTLKLKAFKMKFFYKRWLDFERKYGNAAGEEEVKQKAREFVQNNG